MRPVRVLNLTLMIVSLLMLAGCATKLVPDYDKALVSGITSTNIGIMELFASTDNGTSKDTFTQREEKYNKLIGHINALKIQSQARPLPQNKINEAVNTFLESRNIPKLPDEIPSAHALMKVSENLVKMRDTDKKQGVTKTEVQAFKNNVVIYMDQALTYESFIER